MELWKSENATKDFFGQLVFNVTKHTSPPAMLPTKGQWHKSSIKTDAGDVEEEETFEP